MGAQVNPNFHLSKLPPRSLQNCFRHLSYMSSMPQHAVFINIAATGHVNPTLPLVKELHNQGVQVTYFMPSENMRCVVESAGAAWRPIPDVIALPEELKEEFGVAPDASPESYVFPLCVLPLAAKYLPSLIDELKALEPRPLAIVYDPFLPQALVAARV